MPIQSRSRGLASAAAAGCGSVGTVDGDLSSAEGLRGAGAIPARPPRRNALVRVIVDLRGSTKGLLEGMDTQTQSRIPEAPFQAKIGRQPFSRSGGQESDRVSARAKAAKRYRSPG